MQTDRKFLSPLFMNTFDSRFNSDIIDLRNASDLTNRAEAVVGDLLWHGMALGEVVHTLEQIQQNWSVNIISEFEAACDVSWTSSLRNEECLKAVVSTMLATAYKEKRTSGAVSITARV